MLQSEISYVNCPLIAYVVVRPSNDRHAHVTFPPMQASNHAKTSPFQCSRFCASFTLTAFDFSYHEINLQICEILGDVTMMCYCKLVGSHHSSDALIRLLAGFWLCMYLFFVSRFYRPNAGNKGWIGVDEIAICSALNGRNQRSPMRANNLWTRDKKQIHAKQMIIFCLCFVSWRCQSRTN